MDTESNEALLKSVLSVAVPMWVERLQSMPWPDVEYRAKGCGQYVAEHGDVILYRSKKKGESAKAFNYLAQGLAALSFLPGGVHFLELHFENIHPDLANTE